MFNGSGEASVAQQQQQAAMIQAQTMILKQTQLQLKVLGTCFTQCVPKMNSELDSSEQKCIYKCVTSLIETEE